MESIKPRINLAGYKKALQEYGNSPSRIIEELVANSYDADATAVVVVHSAHEIMVVDNGTGVTDEQFPRMLDLGAGTKIGSHDSSLKRSYLGSFGFGVKSTINIAKDITIASRNKSHVLTCEIDVAELESRGFKDDWAGFPIAQVKGAPASARGTAVWLRLKTELNPDHLEDIKRSLYNLPKAKDFAIYLVPRKRASKAFATASPAAIEGLKREIKKFKGDRISGSLDIGSPKAMKCTLAGSETIDLAVWCKGLDSNMKVPSLGQFGGVYVKVDGRVLKRNFQGEKVLDGVSKYPKFKHGMRIEVPIDWLKEQISLGRDGLQFGNEASKRKFENELRLAVTTAVKPFAKALENRKLRKATQAAGIRIRKAMERIAKKSALTQLTPTGYAYVPTDDYEMALLVANPAVLRKLSISWVLMDFNGQQDFDCLVYDKGTTEFLKVELEPTLEGFLGQDIPDNTDYVVTWTRGDWKVGKGKTGKKGYYELVESKNGPGHYRLLLKASKKSKEPKQTWPVFCIDQALQR